MRRLTRAYRAELNRAARRCRINPIVIRALDEAYYEATGKYPVREPEAKRKVRRVDPRRSP